MLVELATPSYAQSIVTFVYGLSPPPLVYFLPRRSGKVTLPISFVESEIEVSNWSNPRCTAELGTPLELLLTTQTSTFHASSIHPFPAILALA